MSSISEGTFQGYVSSTHDALLIFEAVRRGIMPKITRRLREDERKLIRSGTVFVFDERESGIKRWTDGLLWSPSRILWNFLVYRQIDRKSVKPPPDQPAFATSQPGFPLPSAPMDQSMSAQGQGSSMRSVALTHSSSTGALDDNNMVSAFGTYSSGSAGASSSMGGYHDASSNFSSQYGSSLHGQAAGMVVAAGSDSAMSRRDNDFERSLVGSLTNSYPFMKEGLCKKTISIQVEGSTQHLISYYTVEDVRHGRLRTPSSLPEIAALCISPIFLNKANFRNPPHIEVGPDGIPRYRGDSNEAPAARMPGHHSGSEGTSSGSDSRDIKSLSSPGSALVAYSPSTATDASFYDPYHQRHPHQIGGSGMLQQSSSSTSLYSGGVSTSRRPSDVQLRRSGSRYEPYSVAAHHGYSTPASPYISPAGGSYYSPSNHSALMRKGSNSSSRNWLFQSSGQSGTPTYYQSGGAGGSAQGSSTAHANVSGPHEELGSSDPFYSFTGSGTSGQQPHDQSSSSYTSKMTQPYQSASASASTSANQGKTDIGGSGGDAIFQFNRGYRGSWDSNQPQQPSNLYTQDTQQPPATSQGLTALSLYSQTAIGGSSAPADDAQPSPPPTSSSYSSHHSFIAHPQLQQPSLPAGSSTVDSSLASKADENSARRPSSGVATSYDMPPPNAPVQRWQTYDQSQSALWHGSSEADRSEVKKEEIWEGSSISSGQAAAPSAMARYSQDESHSRPSSSSGYHQRRGVTSMPGSDEADSGLEKVVLTKPAT